MPQTRKVLLEFYLTENELYIFIIRPDVPELKIKDEAPIVLKVDVKQVEVELLIDKIRADFHTIRMEDGRPNYENHNLDTFYELGKKIFNSDLLQYIKDFEAIYLVPFGLLHYLPMHALKIEDKYLIELFQIAYLPSASVLQYLQKNQALQNKSILLGGVDSTREEPNFWWETDHISKLPYWEDQEKIYLKDRALTKKAFLDNCQGKSIIHLSTHGHFIKEDPLSSGVSLFGEYSRAYLRGQGIQTSDYSNLLTARDFFESTQLNTDLFVMSGCVTGDSENKAGDELVGLTRSLIYSGAKTMIVSLFPTFKQITAKQDQPGLQFANFYSLWLGKKLSKGKAFQQYILGILNSEFHHPYYWFPFIMVGNLE